MSNKIRTRFWVGAILIALIALVLLTTPYAIHYGVTQWLDGRGATQATLDDVDFNPVTGALILHGLRTGAIEARALAIRRAELRLAWLPLLRKQVHVTRLRIDDADVAWETDTHGARRIAGLSPESLKTSPDTAPTTWQFSVERVEISRSTLRYRTPQTDADLTLERAELDFADRPDAASSTTSIPMRARLRFRLNGKLDARQRPSNVHAHLSWKSEGSADYDPSTTPRWRMTGNLMLSDTELDAPDRQLRLASVKNLNIEDITADETWMLNAGLVRLDDFALGAPMGPAAPEPALRAARVDLENLRLAPGQPADIESITLHGAHLVARRLEQNRWHVFDRLSAPSPDGPEAAARTPLPRLRIAELRLHDGAELTLEDRGFDPPLRIRAEITEARVERFDTAPAAPPIPFTLAGRIGKYSQFRLTGQARPFAPQTELEAKGEIRELDLLPWSPYAVREIGYEFKSGHLHVGTEVAVAGGKLRGEGRFTFGNTEIAPVDPDKVAQLTARLTVPLDTALIMLRDSNNNVQLNIALAGAVDDPQFDFRDVVKRGLNKALRSATVAYLKYYFQPYGSFITMAELAGKAFQLRLDPVFFSPGASTLDDTAQTYLNRVADLMRDRPNMRIRLCGKAVPADGLEDKNSAQTLAEARAETIKEYLVASHRTATDRLFICRPEIDDRTDAKPRADLVL